MRTDHVGQKNLESGSLMKDTVICACLNNARVSEWSS
jgi:hypothetical protein